MSSISYLTNYLTAKVISFITCHVTFVTQPNSVSGAFKQLPIPHTHMDTLTEYM